MNAKARWIGLAVCLGACSGSKDADDTGIAYVAPPFFHYAQPTQCADPVDGMDRFHEEGQERGLTLALPGEEEVFEREVAGVGGNLVAADFDDDGDTDLLVGGLDGLPVLYENDGEAHFTAHQGSVILDVQGARGMLAISAADLNGDRLPDVVAVGGGFFVVAENQGDFQFEQSLVQMVGDQADPFIFLTLAIGDVDGNGLLDMVLPSASRSSTGSSPDPNIYFGGPDFVLLQHEDGFVESAELYSEGEGSRSQLATLSDRDGDGDLDVFIPADLGPPSAFWRNDGLDGDGTLVLVDDAAEISADVVMAAMGIDNTDLNGDGALDYVISDVGPPRVLLSDGQGGFVDSGRSLGLSVEEISEEGFSTVGWSVDLVDFNQDGILDLVQASGPDPAAHRLGVLEFPDMLWQGRADGTFVDRTELSGLGDTSNHLGLVSADLDGNGSMDIVAVGPKTRPRFWRNDCSEGAWIRVALQGPPSNTMAFGARVTAAWGDQVVPRELHSLRAQGQTPPEVHFGLGEVVTLDWLEITWPDGHVERAEEVPVNRVVTVFHPEAEVSERFGTER